MATLKSSKDGKEIILPDGSPIKDFCESIGVPFGCKDGLCGTCVVDVLKGMENLSPRNEKENDLGLTGNSRLSCQCLIKKGTVIVEY